MNIVRTTTWQADDTGEIRVIDTMEAPSFEVLSVQPAQQVEDLCILVCVEVPRRTSTQFHLRGMSAKAVYSKLKGNPLGTPVIGKLTPGAPSTIVVEGASKTMEAFQPQGKPVPETI